MKRTALHLLRIIVLLIFSAPIIELHAQTYWIAFARSLNQSGAATYFLLRIDQFGNIISGPTAVIAKGNFSFDFTLGNSDKNNFNLWTGSSNPHQRNIHRLVISKTTFRAVKTFTTGLLADDAKLQVSQKESGNFLGYIAKDNLSYNAVQLRDKGVATSKEWKLLRNPNRIFLQNVGRISADGRLFFYNFYNVPGSLAIQRLDATGRPTQKPEFLKCCTKDPYFQSFFDTDSSNKLSNERRLVVYIVQRREAFDEQPDRLFSRIIDAHSLKPLEKPVLLHTGIDSGDANGLGIFSVSVDPLGRFVLYIEFGIDNYLVFQSLDSNGKKAGPRKILFQSYDLAYNVDFLMDRDTTLPSQKVQ